MNEIDLRQFEPDQVADRLQARITELAPSVMDADGEMLNTVSEALELVRDFERDESDYICAVFGKNEIFRLWAESVVRVVTSGLLNAFVADGTKRNQ